MKDAGPLAMTNARETAMATTTAADQTLAQRWNTKNLGLRLLTDVVSAASAAALVAPVISIIDRSIMENASGRNSIGRSLRSSLASLALRPHTIILSRPFALIFMLYGGTYLTANTLDTATSTARRLPASHVTSGTAKFAASSAANVGLCIYKDQVFVRMFGPSGVLPRPVPLASYALFAARDCLTIFASFNLPPILAPWLTDRMRNFGGPSANSAKSAEPWLTGLTAAQFAAPAAVQLVSTPMHLLGLDLYNRPGVPAATVPWSERWAAVRKNWAVSAAARVCRIVPAFGVGGVVNRNVRMGLMTRLE